MKRTFSRLLWLSLALLLGSCSDVLVPRTQVLVQIEAGPAVRQRADMLQVTFFSGKGDPSRYTQSAEERFPIDASFRWPASLALVPKGGDASRGFRIEVEAREGEQRLVAARVISQFVAEKTLLLEIVLVDACIDFLSCDDTQTCLAEQEGPRCGDAKVNPRTLKEVDRIPDAGDSESDASSGDAGTDEDAAGQPRDDGGQAANDAAEPAREAGSEDAAQSAEAGADGGACGTREACLNGSDDDCDDLPDCADPDCDASSRCVADSEDMLGVVVRSIDACPAGYGNPRPLYNNLNAPGCTGCSCGAISPTQCSINAAVGCDNPGAAVSVSARDCPTMPNLGYAITGFVTFSWNVQAGSCPASGTARPAAPFWEETVYLCRPLQKGTGCAAAEACVPKPTSANEPLCYKPAPGQACAPDDLGERLWYTGYDDSRSCGPCTCESSGGGCSNMDVAIHSSCSAAPVATLSANQKNCGTFAQFNYYAYLRGTPTNGTCTPRATQNGRVAASGATVLCCRD